MPLNEVKPGMKGYGLSVFQGTKIEKFPITVLGVTKEFNAGISTILIKIEGGYCVENATGVVLGMSGSPIYINGKIIGAIAYGTSFGKTPIFGVQPIEDMLEAWNINSDKDALKPVKEGGRITIEGKEYIPLKSLFLVSGLSEKNIEILNKEFPGLGNFQAAGGGSFYKGEKFELAPGAAVGPILARGDIEMTGVGTLSYVKDGKFLAFGHDMMNMGKVNMPLSVFYIQSVVPSYMASFKVGSPIKEVGIFKNDTFVAIAGDLSGCAQMLPMNINLQAGGKDKKFHLEIARIDHPVIPFLMSAAIDEAANKALISGMEGTARVSFNFTLEDRTISYKNTFYDSVNPLSDARMEFRRILARLMGNEFKKVKFKNIEVGIKCAPGNPTAAIEKIYMERPLSEKDKTSNLHVLVKPYNAAPFEKVFKINIPQGVTKGRLDAGASGGFAYERMERKIRAGRKFITNFDQLVDDITRTERNDQLIVKVAFPKNTVNVSGISYPFLPAYIVDMFKSSPQSGITIEPDTATYKIDIPYLITNYETVKLRFPSDYADKEEKTDEEDAEDDLSLFTMQNKFKGLADTPKKEVNADEVKDEAKKETTPAKEEAPKKDEDKKPKEEKEDFKEKKTDILPLTSFLFEDAQVKDFIEGELEGAAVSDAGYVCLGDEKKVLYKSGRNFIYSSAYNEKLGALIIADQKGDIINASTGRVIANTGRGIAGSVLCLPDGAVCASSGGKIFKLTQDGEKVLLCDLPVKYIWDMKLHNNYIWAATGIPAQVYKIDLRGASQKYLSVNDLHAKALAFRGEDLIIGTADDGIVYCAGRDKKPVPLFQKSKTAVADLGVDKEGNIYAACANTLVKITPKGATYIYGVDDKYITALAVDGKNGVIFGTAQDGKIYKLLQNEEQFLLHDLKCADVFDISADNAGNFYFVTGDEASVVKTGAPLSGSGEFISRVVDLKEVSSFGNAGFKKDAPQGTGLSVYLRCGNTKDADESWQEWTFLSGEGLVKLPPARYFQYKVKLKTQKPDVTPKFFGISLKYKPLYKTPYLSFVFPWTFDKLNGKQDIEWICGDTNLDIIRFDIDFSRSNANEWKKAARDLPVILKKKEAKEDKNPVSTKQVYSWDTAKIADGEYKLRLTAYCLLNKDLKVEIISKPFVVCNTKPRITVVNKKITNGALFLEGKVICNGVYPKIVKFSFDGQLWYLANPKSGMYGGFEDDFLIRADIPEVSGKIDKSGGKLFIAAEDEAGNKGELKTDL